jgi:iron complex outermembrane receptor protein
LVNLIHQQSGNTYFCNIVSFLVKYLFSILFFWGGILNISIGQACKLTLQITVLDDHSREPLEGTSVNLEGVEKVWFTESNGKVLISGLCPGNYRFTISHIGCEPRQIQVALNSSTAREVLLHHVKVELGEVSVVGYRQGETEVRADLRGTRLFARRGLNLAQSLEAVNGVRTLSTGATIGKPIINGLHSNRIVLVTNGVKLESQQWGTDHAPEIDPYNAEKFTVIKGAASVRYGAEAIAGVVLAEPRPLPQEKTLRGELNLAAFSNNGAGVISGLLEGGTNGKTNFGWRVQGTLKKAGSVRVPGFWLANTAMDEGNFSAAIGLAKNQWNWDASFSYFSTQLGLYPGAHVDNLDDLNNAIASEKPLFPGEFSYRIGRPYQQASHWTAKLGTKVLWNSKQNSSFWIAHQENSRDEFDARSFNPFPELSLDMGTTSAELVHNIEAAKGITWQNGANFSFQQNINNPTSARIFIRNFETWNLGGFSILKMKGGGFTNEIGVRYDYKNFESFYRQNGALIEHTRTFSNVTATIGTHYEILKGLGVTINLASAWRPPAPNELYANGLHQGLAAVEIGNQDFKAERGLNANLQLTYRSDSTFHFEVSVYNNRIRDFIYLQPVQPPELTINGYYPKFEYRQTDANLAGLDVFTSFAPWPSLEFYGKMNLLYARDLKADDWLIWMPADRFESGFTLFPNMGRRFMKPYFKTGISYTKEQKRVPEFKDNPDWNDYAPPPPAYGLVELEFGTILTKSNIQAGLSIYNLTNEKYRDYMNRFRYFTDEAGINVALRLKIPFSFKNS